MREKAGGRGDKEEEERTKPLSFSTPGARRTTGDAARRLHPSPLGSRGAGDAEAVAGVPRGSVHPRHGQRGEWGGRGGREGCNLNPLPSH